MNIAILDEQASRRFSKGRQNNYRTAKMTLSAWEFVRRFLLHVLPFRFMKIRILRLSCQFLYAESGTVDPQIDPQAISIWHIGKETTRGKMLPLIGKDILLCRYCKQGRMIYQGAILSASTS